MTQIKMNAAGISRRGDATVTHIGGLHQRAVEQQCFNLLKTMVRADQMSAHSPFGRPVQKDWIDRSFLRSSPLHAVIIAMSACNILVIDDHAMFRCGLCMVLRADRPQADIVEAASLDEAMRMDLSDPNLILLDIELQGLNGLACIAVLKSRWPQTPIIMLSSHASPATVRQALARGAAAFVAKADSATTLVAAISRVLHRSPAAPSSLVDVPGNGVHLTPRQLEVLDLLSQGLPNKTIGRHLGLSENTVRGHVQAVLGVLQVSSRSEAAFVARRQGLIA